MRWGQRCSRLKRSSKIESTLDETNRFAFVYPPEMGWPAPGKEVSHLRTTWCTKLINRMLLEKCAGELEVRQTGVAWPWHQKRWRALVMGWNQVTSQPNQFHSCLLQVLSQSASVEKIPYIYLHVFLNIYYILALHDNDVMHIFWNVLKHFGPKCSVFVSVFLFFFIISISLTLQAT